MSRYNIGKQLIFLERKKKILLSRTLRLYADIGPQTSGKVIITVVAEI